MRQHWMAWAVLGALIASCGCGGVRPEPGDSQTGNRMRQALAGEEGVPGAKEGLIERGDPKAEVRLEAYYPLNKGHREMADLVLSFADRYPGKVYTRVADFRWGRGQRLWTEAGLTCGCIQINGRTDFLLRGHKEPTSFTQKIDVNWTKAELEQAVKAAVEGTLKASG